MQKCFTLSIGKPNPAFGQDSWRNILRSCSVPHLSAARYTFFDFLLYVPLNQPVKKGIQGRVSQKEQPRYIHSGVRRVSRSFCVAERLFKMKIGCKEPATNEHQDHDAKYRYRSIVIWMSWFCLERCSFTICRAFHIRFHSSTWQFALCSTPCTGHGQIRCSEFCFFQHIFCRHSNGVVEVHLIFEALLLFFMSLYDAHDSQVRQR